jgi:hypothetical protein
VQNKYRIESNIWWMESKLLKNNWTIYFCLSQNYLLHNYYNSSLNLKVSNFNLNVAFELRARPLRFLLQIKAYKKLFQRLIFQSHFSGKNRKSHNFAYFWTLTENNIRLRQKIMQNCGIFDTLVIEICNKIYLNASVENFVNNKLLEL